MIVDLIETHWSLSPDQQVEWLNATRDLDPDVAAKAVTFLASSSPDTPSISLFMVTYRVELKKRPFDMRTWLDAQRAELRRGAMVREMSKPERQRRYGLRRGESRRESSSPS